MSTDELKSRLEAFANYALNLKGDEKGEAQLFLDHFFRALGHSGITEMGATLEHRVAKPRAKCEPDPQLELIQAPKQKAAKTGKKFADLLWPKRVLIEMKSRGEDLERHYDQAFDYWSHIVPHRPPFVILCNFDEFWIYDFSTQLFDPVDRIPIRELADRRSALNFLLPAERAPIFDNNRVAVTRTAAASIAEVFNALIKRGEDRTRAQRFILQTLLAMFAEDVGLLPNVIVTQLVRDSLEGQSSFDLLGGLFRQMNNPNAASGGRYQNVPYFNGGLFATVDPVELKHGELYSLEIATREDWSRVQPAIFGTLFQSSMDKGARHAYGAHFTSEADIQRVVAATITRPWKERIASARTVSDLLTARRALLDFKVLDPACGSGNFLYVAYRELKRIERELLVRIRGVSRSGENTKLESAVSLHQFYGIDNQPFAVELAKVTLLLAKELEIKENEKLGEQGSLTFDKALPLDNLDKNILCADALFCEWPIADAIIGNPPFQSKNKMQKEFEVDYIHKVREAYSGVPGRADYCVYWFRKAHDNLPDGARAGLVGTNTIRQNFSREGGLDYIAKHGGTITDAVSSQVWSGDAVVHVSIVNWIKGTSTGPKRLSLQLGDHLNSPWKDAYLPVINTALSFGTDVTTARRLNVNITSGCCSQGQTHGQKSFLLSPREALEMLRQDSNNKSVIFPFMIADDLLSDINSRPSRFVIDFSEQNALEARAFVAPFERIKTFVLPVREKAALRETQRNKKVLERNPKAKVNHHHANFLKHWWRLSYHREDLVKELSNVSRYIVCGRVTKRPIFEFISTKIRPNDALTVFPMDDDYSFGILQSGIHFEWFKARCSTLKADPRYTSDTVFDSYPWPQQPNLKSVRKVADAAIALRHLRKKLMTEMKFSLRDLYRTLDDPGEHPLREAQDFLDSAVREAYDMTENEDSLAFCLQLNLQIAQLEDQYKEATGPGLPAAVKKRKDFVTTDCVEPC